MRCIHIVDTAKCIHISNTVYPDLQYVYPDCWYIIPNVHQVSRVDRGGGGTKLKINFILYTYSAS